MTLIISSYLLIMGMQQPVPTDSVSLKYCYLQAAANYPIEQNVELQQEITDLNVRIANAAYFPNISINGKATYQSEVTEFSLPGGGGPPAVSNDQYEAALNVTQNIFNGRAVGTRKKLERAIGQQEMYSTQKKLHEIRSQVSQVYYGILLSRQQAKIKELLIENLRERLSMVRAGVENGALLPSQQYILEAELIKAQQDSAEIQSNTKAGYRVLNELIDVNIDANTRITLPSTDINYKSIQPQRAEYKLFKNSRNVLDLQKKFARTKRIPRISAFGTAAYGRPGLNFLNDKFHEYYIVGIQLRWNIRDFSNANKEKEVLEIKQQKIIQRRKAFDRQLNAELQQTAENIASIRENMERDRGIIKLRDQITKETSSQLENGVITATEYVTELNQANQARLSLFINRVRLSQAQTKYRTILGQPIHKFN